MRLYIPALGDKLRLTSPWTFTVHLEDRNRTLICGIEGLPKLGSWQWTMATNSYYSNRHGGIVDWAKTYPKEYTLPAGTILKADRIYIRKVGGKAATEFNSITFVISNTGDGQFGRGTRFWVNLDDANKIEFEMEES